MKIGYVTFGKDDFGFGLSYCLALNKIDARVATVKTAKHFDVILFSIFWWDHVYDFVRFCVKAGIGNKKKSPVVIVGGFNSFNPLVFMPWAHKVVVGDGENVIKAAIDGKRHESIFTPRKKSVVYANADISKNQYSYQHGTISRIEIARGCKYKCPYCQLTYLKKYREVDLECVKQAIDKVQTKRVALFAPNGMSHSQYAEIVEYTGDKSLVNVASDVRFNELHYFENNNTARMGMEGISERLRKAVTNKISNEEFVELVKFRMKQCEERGYRPSMHTYFILDLPKEEQQDWDEFEELLQMVNVIPGVEALTWIITGNVFMPCPHTPYEDKDIHIDRDYRKIWRHALSDFWRDKKFNFTLTGRHSVFSPYSRLLSMIATRGGAEAGELIYNIVNNKKLKHHSVGKWQKSLSTLVRFLEHYGGVEKYTGVPTEKPWDIVKINRK